MGMKRGRKDGAISGQNLSGQQGKLYWTWVSYKGWKFIAAATEKGLCYVGSPYLREADFADWARKWMPDRLPVQDESECRPYVGQLIEYLDGKRTSFTIPVDVQGTPFQLQVWEALRRIPYGKTVSYSDISGEIGKPSSVRAVGTAIGANPVLMVIPCHRVVAKNGSLAGYRGGLEMKARLLELESRPS